MNQQIVMADNSFRQFTSIRVIGRNRHSIVTILLSYYLTILLSYLLSYYLTILQLLCTP